MLSCKRVGAPKDLFPLIFSVTPKSHGLPGSLRKLLCEVTPASGQEHFVWSPLDERSRRTSPGPWLLMPEARLLSQPWQCHLYQGQRLLGTAVYLAELSRPGPRPHSAIAPTPDQSPPSHFQTSSPHHAPSPLFLSSQGADLQLLSRPDPLLPIIS